MQTDLKRKFALCTGQNLSGGTRTKTEKRRLLHVAGGIFEVSARRLGRRPVVRPSRALISAPFGILRSSAGRLVSNRVYGSDADANRRHAEKVERLESAAFFVTVGIYELRAAASRS